MIKILSIVILFLIVLTSLLYVVFRFIQPVKPIDLTSEDNKTVEKKKSGPWSSLPPEIWGWLQFMVKIALVWIIIAWFFDWPFNPKEAKKRVVNSIARQTAVTAPREEWRTIFSANLSGDEWSEWVDVRGYKWKFSQTDYAELQFFGNEAIYKTSPNSHTKFGKQPSGRFRLKGKGKISVDILN